MSRKGISGWFSPLLGPPSCRPAHGGDQSTDSESGFHNELIRKAHGKTDVNLISGFHQALGQFGATA